jgi:putative flippase GtrA
MAGNIFFMRLLVGGGMLEPVAANLLSILCCSLVNFLLSDRFVFISPHSLRPRR